MRFHRRFILYGWGSPGAKSRLPQHIKGAVKISGVAAQFEREPPVSSFSFDVEGDHLSALRQTICALQSENDNILHINNVKLHGI